MFTREDLKRISDAHPGQGLVVVLGNGQRYRLPTVEHYRPEENYLHLMDTQGRDVYVAWSWIGAVVPLPVHRRAAPGA